MSQRSQALKLRTQQFAVAIVRLSDQLPNTFAGSRVARQLLDAATSVAANYRAVCRAYTRPIFIAKLAIVDEEADETVFWLQMIRETGLSDALALSALEREAYELACIFSASLRTARANARRAKESTRRKADRS